MQKIVHDTNIIVSALIQRSYPFLIIYYLFLEDKFELCLSDELLAEYYTVLLRPKFSKYPDFILKAKSVLTSIESKSIKYFPDTKTDLIKDKDDNKILELSLISKADFIITGNTNDFTFPLFRNTKIVGPNEYWEKWKPL